MILKKWFLEIMLTKVLFLFLGFKLDLGDYLGFFPSLMTEDEEDSSFYFTYFDQASWMRLVSCLK